jgi:hypothetical protein
VYPDLELAIATFGEPDIIVGVKDIWMEYPRIDYFVTFHVDRIPRELERRRKLGYPDPKAVWTYNGVRVPKIPIPVKMHKVRGGSSGLLGAIVGTIEADRAVLAGIPLDTNMRHYHNRKHGKPWAEGRLYKPHWEQMKPELQDKVKSMSGWTMKLLGAPTVDWVHGRTSQIAQAG